MKSSAKFDIQVRPLDPRSFSIGGSTARGETAYPVSYRDVSRIIRYHCLCSADGMTDNSLFTASEAWKGGNYELFIPVASSEDLGSLLKTLWTFPHLEGCYLRRDCELVTQPRVRPSEHGIEQRLYGLVTLPNRNVIPCASYVMDYAGEVDSPPAHWVSFVLTMGALSTAYPVGAYPFGSMDKVSEWKTQVDSLLTEVAWWVHGRIPLEFALIGFEVDGATVSPDAIRENGIPLQREAGILWNDGVELKWYPATRP